MLPRRIHSEKDFMYGNISFSVTSVRIYLFLDVNCELAN